MEKTNSQQSRGGRSKNKAAMTSRSSKNIDQNDVFGKFEMLSLRDDKALSAKSKGAPLREKNQAETATPAAVDKSNKQSPKKSHRNSGSGKKKKGNKKNALGTKPPAVVVEISAATIATSNRKSSAGKNNNKKNSNGKESVTAAQDQDVENIPPEHCHDGVYPGYYFEGYYYPDYGYYHDYAYQYYQSYDHDENDMAYHYHYGNMSDHDQSHALNIDAPSFAPTNEDD